APASDRARPGRERAGGGAAPGGHSAHAPGDGGRARDLQRRAGPGRRPEADRHGGVHQSGVRPRRARALSAPPARGAGARAADRVGFAMAGDAARDPSVQLRELARVILVTMPGPALGTQAGPRVLWLVYTRGPVTLGAVDEERLAAQLDQDPNFSLLGGTVRRAEGEHIVAFGVRVRTFPKAATVGAALEPWRTRSGFALKYAVAQGPGVAHTVDTVVAAV